MLTLKYTLLFPKTVSKELIAHFFSRYRRSKLPIKRFIFYVKKKIAIVALPMKVNRLEKIATTIFAPNML